MASRSRNFAGTERSGGRATGPLFYAIMKTLLLFLTLPLCAATLVIDAGSPTEQDCAAIPAGSAPCFSGGFTYTIQPAEDTTLRYAWAPAGTPPPFSYSIPATDDVAYIVTLRFLEPSPLPPARVFSVTLNDQLIYPRLTLPPAGVKFARSFVAVASNGFLNLRFDTITRGAIISAIEVTPLLQPAPVTVTSFPAVAERALCKSGLILAGPIGPGVPPGSMWPGLKKAADLPADIPQGYSAYSCDGLEYYRFKLADGTTTGPYVAVRMPDDFAPDPALWVKQ